MVQAHIPFGEIHLVCQHSQLLAGVPVNIDMKQTSV